MHVHSRVVESRGMWGVRGTLLGDWNEIYIASNAHPDTWYPEGMPEGLERRIATSVYFPPKKGS